MSKADNENTTKTAASVQVAERAKKKPRKLPPYHVVLLNDDDHSYEYVIEMLKAIFAHTDQEGFRIATEVDTGGRAVVFTTHKELAELKRDQIHSFGKDDRVATCQGSMTAIVQPADGDSEI